MTTDIIAFDAGPTRTYPKGRPCYYDPSTGRLVVIRHKLTETYLVREFSPDPLQGERPSRAFEFKKLSTGEVHHCLVGRDRKTCDCRGKTSDVSRIADDLAQYRGENVYLTWGCVHLDCLVELLARDAL